MFARDKLNLYLILCALIAARPASLPAQTDCIEFGDYLHVVTGVELEGEATHRIAHAGDWAYIASDAGLQVVDIVDPAAPEVVTTLSLSGAIGLAAGPDHACVVGDACELVVVDITNPIAPVAVGGLATVARSYRYKVGA